MMELLEVVLLELITEELLMMELEDIVELEEATELLEA